MDCLGSQIKSLILVFLFLSTLGVALASYSNGSSYESIKSLRESLLSPDNYSTELRPVADQRDLVNINVTFVLMGVVSLDDVKRKMITSGYFSLHWKDQTRSWTPSDFGGISHLELQAKEVWRPRLQIVNAVHDRDPFEDKDSYTAITSDGKTIWQPGGIFNIDCELDLTNYPFDVQTCKMRLCPINHDHRTLQLNIDKNVDTAFYISNSEWDLISCTAKNERITLIGNSTFSCTTIQFELIRSYSSILTNLFVPLIVLSFLNILVFLIPVRSGEKISYAITVVLAMIVYQGSSNFLLPQVSDMNPFFTIYPLFNLIVSLVTVGAVVWTEYLYHHFEMREKANRIRCVPFGARLISLLMKVTACKLCKKKDKERMPLLSEEEREEGRQREEEDEVEEEEEEEEGGNSIQRRDTHTHRHNNYKGLNRFVDRALFRVFFWIWSISFVCFYVWFGFPLIRSSSERGTVIVGYKNVNH